MRRFRQLFMLVLMVCMSIVAAHADKRYTPVGYGDAASAWTQENGNIREGVPVILQNALTTSYDVLSGGQKASYIGDDAVFVLESAGTEGTYRLKSQSTGLYLQDPVNGGSTSVVYTDSKARAFVFTVKDLEYWPSDVITPGEDETRDWTTASNVTTALEGAVVLTRSDVEEGTALSNVNWLQANKAKSNPTFGHDYTANAWVIYEAQQLTGVDYLMQVMDELYPEGRTTAENLYDVGDQPGQINQALYDELLNAFDAINALVNNGNPSEEECEAAYDRCKNSIENAKNGAVPVEEGYYYFRVNQKVDGNIREKNAAYDNGSNIKWSYKTDWELSETPNPADAKYIWHIIPNTIDDRGGYFIQNIYTKRYVGGVKSRDTALPTTVEPETPWIILPQDGNKGFFTVESMDLIANPVIGADGVTKATAMHCPNWTDIVVVWTNTDTNGCAWKFMTVSEDMVKQIENAMVQYDLNNNLQTLYDKAKASYDGSIVYSIKGTTGKDDLTVGGLVTTKDQLSSNAPDKDEGKDIGLLLDGDPTTFFHTDWHGEYDVEYHSLAVDLKDAYSNIVLKMWRRINGDWNGINNGSNNPAPKTLIVYGSNDGMGQQTDLVGEFTCDWSTAAYSAGKNKTVENGIGYCNVEAAKAYRYYTFLVKERMNNSDSKFYNLGEVRVYEGPSYYDASKSLIEAVPADVRTNFETALSKAKEELDAELATEATTTSLNAAYNAFLDNLPDPNIVKNLISEAKAQASAADESSDEMGYFEAGASEALLNALTPIEAQVKDVMTVAEINGLKAQIQAVLDAFNAKLITPKEGMYVYIQSTSKATDNNPPTDAYLCTLNSGASRVKWYAAELNDLESMPNYVWRVEKNDKGQFRFRNMGTGEYMNAPKALNAAVTTSQDADTCYVSLRSAKVGGSFNFVLTSGLYANAQPNSHNLVVWNSASGNDNSAFQFIEAMPYSGEYIYNASKVAQIITLPVEVSATIGEGKLYSVKGQTPDHRVYLEELSGNIAAGTPFVFVPGDAMTDNSIVFVTSASDFNDMEYSFTASTVNGLVGTQAATTVGEGKGKVLNGIVAVTAADETISANTGYFDAVPQISEDEATDVYLEAEGVLNAISNVITDKAHATVDVYTLSGIKVRSHVNAASATKALPAGIYVVGGQKVVVK